MTTTQRFLVGAAACLLPVALLAQAPAPAPAGRGAAPPAPAGRGGPPAYPARPPDPAMVERGSAIYSVNRAFCHGRDTRGGDGGSSLLRSQLVLGNQNGELIAPVVQNGLPPQMPKFDFTAAQIADIAAFLHSFPINSRDPARVRPETILTGEARAGAIYSLTQINQSNVKNLTLAWAARFTAGAGPGGGGAAPGAAPGLIVGGEGTGHLVFAGTNIRGSILQVNGILYPTTPDNVWAVDARDGREIWHYFWKTRGGTHIGNRGAGMWGNLFIETPDNYLVSLDARTGKERWHKVISSFEEQYFSTMAPIVVGNHVLVGTGNDLDAPGFLQSFDPETGELQWKLYTVPMKEGDPGLETWKNLDAARHGGAQVWLPGSYDPETRLYITGTGNPTPAYTSQVRGAGDNLFTCSLIAVNVDTGKMQWYYQTSPHDTHDWDSAQTPALVDAPFGGRMRKLVLTAARNGYFFTLDRVTGEHLVTGKFSETANWATGINAKGQPVRDPKKDHDIAGALVSAANGGAVNWPPPTFSPDTGLFYVSLSESWATYYLAETDPRGAMGLGGKEEVGLGGETFLAAIDYRTGKVVWKQKYPSATGGGGGTGLLSTAGRLLFANDAGGNIVARDVANGKPLWHSPIGNGSHAPQTYMLDGKQYLLVAVGNTLYAFALY